jgi:hypothetical protein
MTTCPVKNKYQVVWISFSLNFMVQILSYNVLNVHVVPPRLLTSWRSLYFQIFLRDSQDFSNLFLCAPPQRTTTNRYRVLTQGRELQAEIDTEESNFTVLTLPSRIPRCYCHCRVRLHGVIDTEKSNYTVSWKLQNQILRYLNTEGSNSMLLLKLRCPIPRCY